MAQEKLKDDLFMMSEALNKAGALSEEEKFHIAVDNFEGPLDVLLMMAKSQKVDLMKVSISALADQYLLFVKEARKLRLELAADYLVMAAWLAFLKSKLLLPPEIEESVDVSAEELALRLQYQLARLNAFREKTQMLMALPQLGSDFFARGAREEMPKNVTVAWKDTLYDILMAYGTRRMVNVRKVYHVRPPAVMRPEEALKRLIPMLGEMSNWTNIFSFFPPLDDQEIVMKKSVYAGTLVACLELAKRGMIQIKQSQMFGDIEIKASLRDDVKVSQEEKSYA